jgi:hypothetical protein
MTNSGPAAVVELAKGATSLTTLATFDSASGYPSFYNDELDDGVTIDAEGNGCDPKKG